MRNGWLIAVVVVVAVAVLAEETPAPMPVDITGVWNLDTMASDDLAAQLEALIEDRLAPTQGPPPGGSSNGMGGMGGMGSRGSRGSQPRQPSEEDDFGKPAPQKDTTTRDLATSLEQLLITVNGADLEIMDGSDQTKIWTPGGPPVQRLGPGGKQVVEQAWWDGAMLVLSTTGGRLAITRRLHLEDSGYTLVADVTVKVTGTSERMSSRLVYHGF